MKKKTYIQPQTETVCFQNLSTLMVVSPDTTHGSGDPNYTPEDLAPPMYVYDELPEMVED